MNNENLIQYLSKFVTEKRFETFQNVVNQRTRHITVILENLFQSHNASAVLRTCDCFGIQDVHMIENNCDFTENPEVALGSSQWINIHRHNKHENNTLDTINKLKQQGYRIIATTPHTDDKTINEVDLTKGKVALLFGSELPGLSQIAMENADEFVKIPMSGFTESFNISVSAAICLYDLSKRLRESNVNWELSHDEKNMILTDWLKTSIKDSENIIKRINV